MANKKHTVRKTLKDTQEILKGKAVYNLWWRKKYAIQEFKKIIRKAWKNWQDFAGKTPKRLIDEKDLQYIDIIFEAYKYVISYNKNPELYDESFLKKGLHMLHVIQTAMKKNIKYNEELLKSPQLPEEERRIKGLIRKLEKERMKILKYYMQNPVEPDHVYDDAINRLLVEIERGTL